MPRLHCTEPLHSGLQLALPAGAARHVQVLRLQPGDPITLFDGRGGEYEAVVTHMGRSEVRAEVRDHHAIECEPAVAVHIALGMPANERMDWLVEKATELGVASIQPLLAERSVLRLSGERAQKKQAHWQGIAIAACEQSGRNRVPLVHEVQPLTGWLARQPAPGLVLSLRAGTQSLRALATGDAVTLLSGPEGGLAAAEEDAALQLGWRPVHLGPRVLRSETAPLAALAVLQGLFLTNNVTFIAINGLVGLSLAPFGWMATLPVMAYVVGGALFTAPVAAAQARLGRQRAFQLGLVVGIAAALLCAYGAATRQFWLVCAGTLVAGYYAANAGLYRFASAELAAPSAREKAVSLVMAGGLIGAIVGPNLAAHTRDLAQAPYVGAYLALAVVALLAMLLLSFMRFPPVVRKTGAAVGRSVLELMRQPVFLVAAVSGALGFGVMNLLMAATPLAMQQCGLPFSDAAFVLQWHVIGMFAPGFFTGHLIKRFGTLPVMGVGAALNLACVAVALNGIELHNFTIALFLLGLGWNFLFTGSTTLALTAYAPEEKDRAQAALNFFVFATLALTSLASGVLVTTQGWTWLNVGSLVPLVLVTGALVWLAMARRRAAAVVVG